MSIRYSRMTNGNDAVAPLMPELLHAFIWDPVPFAILA